jgi:hypothetical protein
LRNEEASKQEKEAREREANQEANKQTLPHVLGFGRYPLSHKPSRPSSKKAKKKSNKARSKLNLTTQELTRGRRPYHSFSHNYEPLQASKKEKK